MALNPTLRNVLLTFAIAAFLEASSAFLDRLKANQPDSEILITIQDQEQKPLPSDLYHHAKNLNAHLNEQFNQTIFNTKLLREPKQVGAHLALPKEQSGHGAQDTVVTTEDGQKITTTFIDHASDTLLIIGSGFSYDRRSLASFACYHPDIVLFQPRGQGIDHQPTTFKGRCSYKLLGVDSAACKLGCVEEQDVIAVTEYYKKQKSYKSVVYLGICYSAVIGAKAAALRPDLFDKMILDGAWPSLKQLLERVIKNPELLRNPQARESSSRLFSHNSLYTNSWLICTEKLFGFSLEHAIEGSSFFPKLNLPILFFQGLNDNMVPVGDFKAVWEMTSECKQKVAILTPSRHIQGHIKHKELYHMLCHMFINNDFETFKQQLEGELPLPALETKAIENLPEVQNYENVIFEPIQEPTMKPVEFLEKPEEVIQEPLSQTNELTLDQELLPNITPSLNHSLTTTLSIPSFE